MSYVRRGQNLSRGFAESSLKPIFFPATPPAGVVFLQQARPNNNILVQQGSTKERERSFLAIKAIYAAENGIYQRIEVSRCGVDLWKRSPIKMTARLGRLMRFMRVLWNARV